MAFLKGRWFCTHLCPMGFIAENVSKLRPSGAKAFKKVPRLGPWLALLCIGGALAGYPLVLWMDPLSIFNGFFSALRLPLVGIAFLPAIGFVVIVIGSVVLPHWWCYRVCPLGGLQDMVGRAGVVMRRHSSRHGKDKKSDGGWDSILSGYPVARRTFIGLLAGGLGGLVVRDALGRRKKQPIRPPGAQPEDQFTALCARCGNCVRACPANIIKPDLGASGVGGLLTPVIDQSESYCYEWCNACTQVCPTGAIEHLLLEQKRNLSIGLAEVTKKDCIAWNDGQYCMVCQEFCPYLAIKSVEHNGVNCPVVDPAMCRGCGTCHNQCPAIPDKAINVKGIVQKPAKPVNPAVNIEKHL
jgi:Pyruvate/2-oxoacid:ferredoxin oxidoreductase delta subunit